MKSFSLSELNRKPGEVVDAAMTGPVFLTKRGKPKLVMMPAATYEALRLRHLAKNPGSTLSEEPSHVNRTGNMTLLIAIDGPAASGKGTLARRLAAHYGLPHLDTGLTYRAVGKFMLDHGFPLDDEADAIAAARNVDLSLLDRRELATHSIGEAASKIAVIPELRRILVEKQREFARQRFGAVLDGRDIGTVVCPDATVKLYITASAEVRAKRRFDEELMRSGDADYEAILEEIEKRDARDTSRSDSPLKPAEDAHLLDTSNMGIEAAFSAAVSIIEKVRALKA